MNPQAFFPMPIVTEEEHRLLQKMFLPRDSNQEPVRMTGEAFVLLFEELRKQTGSKRLQEAQDDEREEVDKCECPEETGAKELDGIQFLWAFFANNISDQLERSIRRRYQLITEPVRTIEPQENLVDELGGQGRLLPLEGENDDDRHSCITFYSSISFFTASDPSGNSRLSSSGTDVSSPIERPGVPIPILGCRGPPEEQYLDTPSSSDQGSVAGVRDGNLWCQDFTAGLGAVSDGPLFHSSLLDLSDEHLLEKDDLPSLSSLSTSSSWEILR